MAGFDYSGESATQAIYTNEWAPYRSNLGATTALANLDFYCGDGATPFPCPADHQSRFWQNQFSSLYALSTIGMSYYNALQVTLRHPVSHGLQVDFSYTYSRSIDMGSDAERSSIYSNGVAFTSSEIINTWKPYLNRAVSDFDTTHIVTANYLYQLPIGRGQAFGGNTNRFVNALIGGWTNSGILRSTSGLPFNLFEPGWTTDWDEEGFGVVTDKKAARVHRHLDSSGNPQFFANPDAINSGIATGSPVRLPYPGEAGQRDHFRGDGFFSLDSGLNKTWNIRDQGRLRFAWEVYNVTNTFRFDTSSTAGLFGSGLTGGNLGIASAQLGSPRRMQFSLRYDF